MINFSSLRHYFWSIFSVIGIVLLWAGIWEGIGGLPYIVNPIVSLVVGLILLSFSGIFKKEFDPLTEAEKSINSLIYNIRRHPHKHEFHISYHDHAKNKRILIHAKHLKGIEKGDFLVVADKKYGETFIPYHRIKEIFHKGKSLWKA